MQDESIDMIEVTPNNGHWNVETEGWHHCLILSLLSIIMNSNNQNITHLSSSSSVNKIFYSSYRYFRTFHRRINISSEQLF